MFFDKETRYWQEEYRKGDLDDVDMLGETRALLDGTAEREAKKVACFFLWALIPTIIMFTFVFLQDRRPVAYVHLQSTLTSWGIALGTEYDPTVFFLLEVIAVIILFNIFRRVYKRRQGKTTEQ